MNNKILPSSWERNAKARGMRANQIAEIMSMFAAGHAVPIFENGEYGVKLTRKGRDYHRKHERLMARVPKHAPRSSRRVH